MHIVTKFLVVLVAVLSVLLSGLAVAYTANADRLAAEVQRMEDQVAGLRASLDEDEAQVAEERIQFNRLLSAKDEELAALRAEMSQLRSDRDSLRSENTRLKLSEGTYVAQIDEFTSTLGTYARLDEQQSDELAELRRDVLESNRKELELLDALADRTTENEVLNETVRALQVQIATLQQELDNRPAGGRAQGQGRVAQASSAALPAQFRSRVTDVRPDGLGRTLVAIDAGSSDQLAEQMKLMVVRGGDFIGNLRLQRVDLNESVGLFEDLTGRQVREGDIVRPAI